MAYEKTRQDSIRYYHTGATADGLPQPDPNMSLGGFRSSNEVELIAYEPFSLINGITIERVSGACGPGEARLRVSEIGHLQFMAPGSSEWGELAQVPPFQTRLVESRCCEAKFVRVTANTYIQEGETLLQLGRRFNNAIGMSNVVDAERTAGEEKVRCVGMKVESVESVEEIYHWTDPLQPAVVSDLGQLPASGVGTIKTSSDVSLWPRFGWAYIETSGLVQREAVYYVLHPADGEIEVFDAAHRGLLGTSASAGAATDLVYPIPGVRVALQAPPFYLSSDENDVPPGLSWILGTRKLDGAYVSEMVSAEQMGLWLRLSVPPIAGSSFAVDPAILSLIGSSFMAA